MKFKKIYIEINNTCNFNCSFCIKTKRVKNRMTLDEIKNILFQIKDYTEYVYLHLMGEPLLHPDLFEVIKLCNDYNLQVSITTNGLLLKDKIDIFTSGLVRQLNISLHSVEKDDMFFDKYIKDVLDSVYLINNSTNTYISLRLWNIKEELNSRQEKIFNYLSNQYNVIIKKEDIKKQKSFKIKDHLFISFDEEFVWPSLKNDINPLYSNCRGLKDMLGILSNGDVVPCCLDSEGGEVLGNIFKTDFIEIINSDRYKDLVNGFKNNQIISPLCQRCTYRNRFIK